MGCTRFTMVMVGVVVVAMSSAMRADAPTAADVAKENAELRGKAEALQRQNAELSAKVEAMRADVARLKAEVERMRKLDASRQGYQGMAGLKVGAAEAAQPPAA